MKLLVPVDGSPASINTITKAIEIAKKQDYSIKIISVVNPNMIWHKRNEKFWNLVNGSIISHGSRVEGEDSVNAELIESSVELLDALLSKLDFTGIKMEKEVVLGEPYEEILSTAKNEDFDLIIMSNRGFSKISNFFLGSVTQRVISESKVPVLVIHTDAES